MLYSAIVLLSIQLAIAGIWFEMARRGRKGGLVLVALGALFSSCVFLSPLVMSQFAMLLLIGAYCLKWRPRPSVFLTLGATASVLLCIVVGNQGQRQWAGLRDRYPLVSLADRLDYETGHVPPGTAVAERGSAGNAMGSSIAPESQELNRLDDLYERDGWRRDRRTAALRQVHESQVSQFVNSAGFGVGRMQLLSPNLIERYWRPEPVPLPQQAAVKPDIASAADVQASPPAVVPADSTLENLHRDALLDFAQPDGFGYVQDREHVAGFEPHGFTQLPMFEQPSQWHIQRVELVSLLKHERPMVYQSEFLPKMDELKTAPVRELDPFEQRGLGKLRSGEDLAIESSDRQIVMLGAIRAATQCLQCHSVDRGALLGAFSYELLPDGQRARVTPDVKPAL